MTRSTEMVCIIGAGRSGTNLLARALEAEGCFLNLYENRYIWNYGQRDLRTDRRQAPEATPEVTRFIRNHFEALGGQNGQILIDKTPGNALRIGFVTQVFPEAKIVNIIRDGRANTLSRGALWDEQSLLDTGDRPGLITRYVRHVKRMRSRGNLPLRRLGVFLADNIPSFLGRLILRRPPLSGERLAGLREIRKIHGPRVARAVQWREVNTLAATEGRSLGSDRYHEIKFEDLLRDPKGTIDALFAFLDLEGGAESLCYLDSVIDAKRLSSLDRADPESLAEITPYLLPALAYFGYDTLQENRSAE